MRNVMSMTMPKKLKTDYCCKYSLTYTVCLCAVSIDCKGLLTPSPSAPSSERRNMAGSLVPPTSRVRHRRRPRW